MVKIEIYRKNLKIVKFTVKGHADFSEFGTDIVCSAVSISATQTLNGILELLKLKPKYEYIEGFISCDLENIDLNGKEGQLDILLESMYEMLKSISDEYSKNVKLIEKEAS